MHRSWYPWRAEFNWGSGIAKSLTACDFSRRRNFWGRRLILACVSLYTRQFLREFLLVRNMHFWGYKSSFEVSGRHNIHIWWPTLVVKGFEAVRFKSSKFLMILLKDFPFSAGLPFCHFCISFCRPVPTVLDFFALFPICTFYFIQSFNNFTNFYFTAYICEQHLSGWHLYN